MGTPHETRDQEVVQEHPLVTELLAELQGIEDNLHWAVQLHTLMHRNYLGPKKLQNRVHAVYAPSHELSNAHR
jgi:hypothetical protein